MAAPVIIRVGCAIDTSVEKTFGDIERRAVRAGKRVEQAMRPGRRRILDDGYVQQAVSQEKRHTKAVEGESKQRQRAFAAEARARRAALNEEERALRSSIREHERAERAKSKAAAASVREQVRASRELDRFATRTSHRATRFFWPNAPLASMARRAGHDIMRGIGVDTTLAGAIGRGTQLQSSATALSTAGYIYGSGDVTGKRVDPSQLLRESRAVANKYGLDPQEAIEGMQGFVTKTGDLGTARELLDRMASLAAATGSSLGDMVSAAGDVSMAFGEPAQSLEEVKARALEVDAVMRTLVAGGKLGTMEPADLAKYMSRITAASGLFGGNRGDVIGQLGVLAQMARPGGAASPAEQARSVKGMADTLATPARRAEFAKHGVQIEQTFMRNGRPVKMLRDPFDIIRDALKKTGGDVEPMKEMFANLVGSKPVTGLSNIYKQAGGGDAGLAAVDAELKRMSDASSMSDAAQKEAIAELLKTTASKAQIFQNKLDEIAEEAAGKLIPALEALAPQALRLAEAFGGVVKWAAENPGKAIVGAIVASILRASLESAFRGAVEAVILRAVRTLPTVPVPGRPGGVPVGPGGGGMGAPGAGPAAGAAMLGLGGLLYELYALEGNRKGGPNQVGATDAFGSTADFLTGGFVGAAARKMGGGSWADAAGELSGNKVFSWLRDFVNDPTGEKGANAQAKSEAAARRAEQARMAQATEAMRDKLGQTLNVRVTNADELRNPPPGGGGGDPDGREKPGA